ncbi:MAG: hypothetical protein GXZ04_00140 [Clostridiales bacterium]|nr:hypothetical protein [Clostridiales bacterium]
MHEYTTRLAMNAPAVYDEYSKPVQSDPPFGRKKDSLAQSMMVMAGAPAEGAPLDIIRNTRAILARVREARAADAKVLLLPELCVSGQAGDLLRHARVLAACREAADTIAKESQGMLVVFGLPYFEDAYVYNTLLAALDGRIVQSVNKRVLHRADHLVFKAGHGADALVDLTPIGIDQKALICFFDDLSDTSAQEASLILAAAARPARAGELASWPASLSQSFADLPVFAFANAGANESTTDAVYPGDAVILQAGQVQAHAPAFSQQMAKAQVTLDLPGNAQTRKPFHTGFVPHPQMPYAPLNAAMRAAWCREALEIAAQALATRMRRIGIRTVTLGISGGLDSTMALMTTLRAFEIEGLDKAGIYALSLPGLGTSKRTKGNAWRLMEAAGLTPREIDLQAALAQHFQDISQPADCFDAAFENAQARERTQVLMDKANQVGGMMVGSGDLSELALGFTTFGGDHISMYGVNAGLYKTAIQLIISQCVKDTRNQGLARVLLDILDTPISPELLSAADGRITQRTEEILGPYLLTDFFLHHFLNEQMAPLAIYERAANVFLGQFPPEEIKTRLRDFFRRFFTSQFKRNCLPDGPAPLGVSLSPRGGFALPSDAAAALYLDEFDKLN